MAHIFDIPLAFEFAPSKLRWQRSGFEIAGPSSAFPPPPATFAGTKIPIPIPKAAVKQTDETLIRLTGKLKTSPWTTGIEGVLLQALPKELAGCLDTVAELEQDGILVPESLTELFLCFDHKDARERAGDPWKMREEFLHLPESNDALLAFLNRWGNWNFGALSVHSYRFSMREFERLESKPWIECVSAFLVWRERKRLREAMLAPPEMWLSNNASLGFTASRQQFPYLGIKAGTCLRAIEITITLDHLRNVKSRICARPDCNNIFTVESNHGKTYCDQYCAHLVSVRRNRSAAKQAKKATSGRTR
ncbi:MAG: hypothetical protein ACRYHB_13020 [Janthinobacterium lividum]